VTAAAFNARRELQVAPVMRESLLLIRPDRLIMAR
jgi:hypothetical protein